MKRWEQCSECQGTGKVKAGFFAGCVSALVVWMLFNVFCYLVYNVLFEILELRQPQELVWWMLGVGLGLSLLFLLKDKQIECLDCDGQGRVEKE